MVETSARSSLIVAVGTVSILVVAVAVHELSSTPRGSNIENGLNRDNEDDDDLKWNDVEDTTESPLPPFPWEPAKVGNNLIQDVYREPHTQNIVAEASSLECKERQPQNSMRSQQLDLLASMTFANGGLRAPSCPCCL
jgi:hypothetical protein